MENVRIVYDIIDNGFKKTYQQEATYEGQTPELIYDYSYGIDSKTWTRKYFQNFKFSGEPTLIHLKSLEDK